MKKKGENIGNIDIYDFTGPSGTAPARKTRTARRTRQPKKPPGGTTGAARPARSEHADQVAVVQRLNWYAPSVVFFAIPNGGSRDGREAIRLKAEGVTPGVPDLFVAEARRRNGRQYHGLFIEMKSAKGRTSKKQDLMLKALGQRGYFCATCKGADEAIKVLEWYLGIWLKP